MCALSPLQLSCGTTYSRRPPSLLGRERNCLNGLPAGLRLLLLLMACAPSRHRVHLATVIDLPGKVESVDRGSASVVPKISSCACRMPVSVVPGYILASWGQLCCPNVFMPEGGYNDRISAELVVWHLSWMQSRADLVAHCGQHKLQPSESVVFLGRE